MRPHADFFDMPIWISEARYVEQFVAEFEHIVHPDRIILITENELEHLIPVVYEALGAVAPVSIVRIPGGDRWKRLTTVEVAAAEAVAAGATRASCVVALGGGYVGNLAGVVAGCLYRGLPLVHMPSTVLAATDSILSRKQAVNLDTGKNHFGLYLKPAAAWICTDFFDTLPMSEIASGLAESYKNALAILPEQLEPLSRITPRLLAGEGSFEDWFRVFGLALGAKEKVMKGDIDEKGKAIVLEYGHTIGHALELASGGAVTHGAAVAYGMRCAARVAQKTYGLSELAVSIHDSVLEPLAATRGPVTVPEILDVVRHDNKRGHVANEGGVPMVLLVGLGDPAVDTETGKPVVTVPLDVVESVVLELT